MTLLELLKSIGIQIRMYTEHTFIDKIGDWMDLDVVYMQYKGAWSLASLDRASYSNLPEFEMSVRSALIRLCAATSKHIEPLRYDKIMSQYDQLNREVTRGATKDVSKEVSVEVDAEDTSKSNPNGCAAPTLPPIGGTNTYTGTPTTSRCQTGFRGTVSKPLNTTEEKLDMPTLKNLSKRERRKAFKERNIGVVYNENHYDRLVAEGALAIVDYN